MPAVASTTRWMHPRLDIAATLFEDRKLVVEVGWERDERVDEDLEVDEVSEAILLIQSCSSEFYSFM